MSDRIVICHPDLEGTPTVSRAAFEQTWRAKGFQKVGAAPDVVTLDVEKDLDDEFDPDTEVTGG